MTPDQNNAKKSEDHELSQPPKAESPTPSNATSWLMQGINRINDTLGEIRKDISELKERVARVEEKTSRIEAQVAETGKDTSDLKQRVTRVEKTIESVPEINQRLRRIEQIIWTVFGIAVAISFIWGAIKIFLSHFTVMPKP